MEITYIDRNHSLITGNQTLEPLHTFHKFPVYIGCTEQPREQDVLADMSVAIDTESGMMQLDKVLPLDVVYSHYHSEALGGVWKEHHLSFVDFVALYKPNRVLEIGGSNGFIAMEYLKKKPHTEWVMVEPTPAIESQGNLKVIARNFDDTFTLDGHVDAVVHSHVFEHIYEPVEFLKSITNFLSQGSFHIFSVPNLYKYLELKYANWINFEHTAFLTEAIIDYLLEAYGYKIVNKKYFLDHSIFYATKKVGDIDTSKPIPNRYTEYKKMFADFMTYHQKLIRRFNTEIEHFEGEVYLFGAHVFSQFLLHMGLKGDIVKILDNSKLKDGKRLYGTGLHVAQPTSIRGKTTPCAVILKAGAYQEEVRRQLMEIRPDVVIWE